MKNALFTAITAICLSGCLETKPRVTTADLEREAIEYCNSSTSLKSDYFLCLVDKTKDIGGIVMRIKREGFLDMAQLSLDYEEGKVSDKQYKISAQRIASEIDGKINDHELRVLSMKHDREMQAIEKLKDAIKGTTCTTYGNVTRCN